MLSERAKQLIPKARIFSVKSILNNYPASVTHTLQKADDNLQYLNDESLSLIKESSPQLEHNLQQSKILRDNAEEIVNNARKAVLSQFPHIVEPEGDLYPPFRAEACWRDFWHFLRCISYAVAGKMTYFTSDEGLDYLKLLYQELKVPLPAMIVGLENLKINSLLFFADEEKSDLTIYFDHLIRQMKKFVLVDQ